MACGHLQKALQLLTGYGRGGAGGVAVDEGRLRGFLGACEGMLKEEVKVEEGKAVGRREPLSGSGSLQFHLQNVDYEVSLWVGGRDYVHCSG